VPDPAFLTQEASPASAAPIVTLIDDAAAVALAHFEQQPAGETTAYVTLTASTGYGLVPLGMWGFTRDADNTVTLIGAVQEGTDG
jgi:hypothetical protein